MTKSLQKKSRVNSPVDQVRRNFMKKGIWFCASAVFGGVGKAAGDDIWKGIKYYVLKGFENTRGADVPSIKHAEWLFGYDPQKCGVMPPGTNRHLLSQGKANPSLYVSTAFDVSKKLHKKLIGLKDETSVTLNESQMLAENRDSLLVIGGPVATELTRTLCGYKDISSDSEPTKVVPIPIEGFPLPFYFHVGNHNGYGYWGDEYRALRRWHENGVEDKFPLYGIYNASSKSYIEPPIDGDRLAGDMLMVLRVPNPDKVRGAITIIGGMHGYSLLEFFSKIDKSMDYLKLINSDNHEYFQALVPYKIRSDRSIEITMSGKSDWHQYIEKIDTTQYLAQFTKPNG